MTVNDLKQGWGDRLNDEMLFAIIQAADTDRSGNIDYTEFIAATLS